MDYVASCFISQTLCNKMQKQKMVKKEKPSQKCNHHFLHLKHSLCNLVLNFPIQVIYEHNENNNGFNKQNKQTEKKD